MVVAVDGEPVGDSLAFLRAVRAAPGEPVALTVERDGSRQDLTLTPVAVQRPVLGAEPVERDGEPLLDADGNPVFPLETVGAIGMGIEFRQGTESLGPVEAVGHSVDTMGNIVTGIWTTFSEKIPTITQVYGPERDPQGFVGVVGAGRISGEVLASDETLAFKVLGFLGLIAGLNFFVGVFNLLPLLPLDGGHIAVLLYEQARDKVKRGVRLRRPAAPRRPHQAAARHVRRGRVLRRLHGVPAGRRHRQPDPPRAVRTPCLSPSACPSCPRPPRRAPSDPPARRSAACPSAAVRRSACSR